MCILSFIDRKHYLTYYNSTNDDELSERNIERKKNGMKHATHVVVILRP